MMTRGQIYRSPVDGIGYRVVTPLQKRKWHTTIASIPEKRVKVSSNGNYSLNENSVCGFDSLPDDLLISILKAASATAKLPSDLINAMLTCRRFCASVTHPHVLAKAAPAALTVKASSWSAGAHRYLKQCCNAGNIEACYTLGMIYFYCMGDRGGGASLMAKAAMKSHTGALQSLSIIQFNGSGGCRKDKDLRSGFTLCARAATLGQVDSLREIGHCLQDGYGVARDVIEGRRVLLEANAREAAAAVASSPQLFLETARRLTERCCVVHCPAHQHLPMINMDMIHRAMVAQAGLRRNPVGGLDTTPVQKLLHGGGGCFLLSDFGCNVPPPKIHLANKFLVEWCALHPPPPGLRLCSHSNCGRSETRKHEFRRCSACGSVNYCSRACQALDWKARHKFECSLVADWEEWEDNDEEEDEMFLQGEDS